RRDTSQPRPNATKWYVATIGQFARDDLLLLYFAGPLRRPLGLSLRGRCDKVTVRATGSRKAMTENRGAVQLRLPDLAGELPPDKRDALAAEIRRLTVLADVADIVTQHLSLDHQLPRLIDRIAEALDAERTTLFLHDRETGELFSRVLRGEGIAEIR